MLRSAWSAVCKHNTGIRIWIAAGQQHLCKISSCRGSPLLPAAQQLWMLGGSSSSTSRTCSKLISVAYGTRSIRTRAPCPESAAVSDEPVAESSAAIQAVLDSCGLSYAAAVSVLRCNSKRALRPADTLDRIRGLQDVFGPAAVNLMLTAVPELLFHETAKLVDCFTNLVELFGSRAITLDVVKRGPDLLLHKPNVIKRRMQMLLEMLQVDHHQLMRLVKKSPVVLKCKPEGLLPAIEFFCSMGGLTPPEVWQLYVGWPILATTTVELLQTRYGLLKQVLQADDAEMRRLMHSWPAHLVRDPDHMVANLKILSEQMGVPRDELLAIIRSEPGLLSWNVSTLVTRCLAVSRVLRLPPELRLGLLSFDRPLLSRLRSLPERLQALQQALGISEDELFPVVHKNLYVVRFPAESIQAKLACAASLAELHPAWQQEWQQQRRHQVLRVLQVGWGCHWRLVYLLYTGQQQSISMFTALQQAQAMFQARYPDFSDWLARYNASVTTQDIPILPFLGGVEVPGGRANWSGPHFYTRVLQNARMGAALHAGSVMNKRRGTGQQQQQHSINSSSSGGGALTAPAGLGSQDTSGSARAAAVVDVGLPATQAGWLAAWWGLPLERAHHFLSQQPSMAKHRWAIWQAKLQALQQLLTTVGWQQAANASELLSSSSTADDSSNDSASSGSTDSTGLRVGGECYQGPALPSVAPANSSELLECPSSSSSTSSVAAALSAAAAAPRIRLQPPAGTAAGVRKALATGHGAALAAVTTACHLPPFAGDLSSPPERPAPAVIELLLAAPAVFGARHVVEHCAKLAALAAASRPLQAELARASAEELAAYIACISPRLRFLQYLVQTQQPYPWKYSLSRLLVSHAWYSDRDKGSVKDKFTAAYPGYSEWEEALEKM